jgi:hypothetical protein
LINGVALPTSGAWPVTLPNQRHHGYCIQILHNGPPWSSFTAF